MSAGAGWNLPLNPDSKSYGTAPPPPPPMGGNFHMYGPYPPMPPPPYSPVAPSYPYGSFGDAPQTPSPYTSPTSPPPPYNPAFPVNETPFTQGFTPPPSSQMAVPTIYPEMQPVQPPQSAPNAFSPPPPSRISYDPVRSSSLPTSPVFQQGEANKPSVGFDVKGNSTSHALYPSLPAETPSNGNISNKEIDGIHMKTPVPPNLVLLWETLGKNVRIFFVQEEGHVISPTEALRFQAFKCPTMCDVSGFPKGCLAGNLRGASIMVKADESWRLGLHKERSYIVKGLQGELAFYDDSTSPARYVIIILSKDTTKEEKQRLDVLLQSSSSWMEEPSNFVDKFESGFGSMFDSVTRSVNSLVKKQTPDLHKSTKWVRKGTGSIVRFGGSIVSKGVHIVSDNVLEKEQPKEASNVHHELFSSLKTYREALESKKVSTVPVNKE